MSITSLSALDGRYQGAVAPVADIFSEYGLIRHRVFVEIKWLKFLAHDLALCHVNDSEIARIDAIYEKFGPEQARSVKEIEKKTNHDVKAVEYYIRQRLEETGLLQLREWVHFACTSEDINNCSYALMLEKGRLVINDALSAVIVRLEDMAKKYKSLPMMARTHGQPATPTTLGKEFVNFAWRLSMEAEKFRSATLSCKMNGASGNFNAHVFAFPNIDWIGACQKFISRDLGLAPLLYTTQINPYHYIAELLHVLTRIAATLLDLNRDAWGYISMGYFRQKIRAGEVGSSTMPHKVNPIDFENSEGNMGLAVCLMNHIAVKLLQSRFQRDLSDSTVLRNLGVIFGYLLVGFKSTLKGLDKIEVNEDVIAGDLVANPALVAEPIQTVMRVYGVENAYEKLKALTRGRELKRETIGRFIDGLDGLPEAVRARMKALGAADYTGLAEALVDNYFSKR
ncbi:MAG: adenylosuccinate lyase [Deltaproteobacteria bacterium]|nr:adenylosuccinate lyase [Deltaproteobacteria bacterium]